MTLPEAEDLTPEQAEYVLIAVNMIVLGLFAAATCERGTPEQENGVETMETGKKHLVSIGVPFN